MIVRTLVAILLDNNYYDFTHAGKQNIGGLCILNASHLIPLKAIAWIDPVFRKKTDSHVDQRDINKHKNDILRLYQRLPSTTHLHPPECIKQDIKVFLDKMKTDKSIDLKRPAYNLHN